SAAGIDSESGSKDRSPRENGCALRAEPRESYNQPSESLAEAACLHNHGAAKCCPAGVILAVDLNLRPCAAHPQIGKDSLKDEVSRHDKLPALRASCPLRPGHPSSS